jgi:ubiquinone/menaquinone biosynthesis C-methylase UbiE
MKGFSYDPYAYNHRYRRVYQEGAEFWEAPFPTSALIEFICRYGFRGGLKVIDLGCGEGRDSIFLARLGFEVTAIDISLAALERGKEASKNILPIDFLAADISMLPLRGYSHHLAINIACLQFLIDQESRDRHLDEAYRVLKDKGIYFSCNVGVDEEVSIEDFYRRMGKRPGEYIERRIRVGGVEKVIHLPIIPVWPKSREGYIREFEEAGFRVLEAYKGVSRPVGECWIIIARRGLDKPIEASPGSKLK